MADFSFSTSHQQLTLDDLQNRVDDWIKKYGVRYFGELTNMCVLTEEVGELARVAARRFGEQSSKQSDLEYKWEDELADVLWVLTCLANQTGVNLTDAFHRNMEKKTLRDSERHKNNEKLSKPDSK